MPWKDRDNPRSIFLITIIALIKSGFSLKYYGAMSQNTSLISSKMETNLAALP